MPNREMPGEFNVWMDPEAAAAVLRSGAPLRWVGLDVTLQVRLTREHAAQMSESSGDFSQLAGESSVAWIDYLASRNPGDTASADSCAMHDPLAIGALTRPDLLTWHDAAVAVVTGDGIARGVMITDLRYAENPPPANCRIATAVDAPGFMDYFLSAVTRL
jgi:purine nucleosidase